LSSVSEQLENFAKNPVYIAVKNPYFGSICDYSSLRIQIQIDKKGKSRKQNRYRKTILTMKLLEWVQG
jgi:hypothetical protein